MWCCVGSAVDGERMTSNKHRLERIPVHRAPRFTFLPTQTDVMNALNAHKRARTNSRVSEPRAHDGKRANTPISEATIPERASDAPETGFNARFLVRSHHVTLTQRNRHHHMHIYMRYVTFWWSMHPNNARPRASVPIIPVSVRRST